MEKYAVDGYSRGSLGKIERMMSEAKKYKEEGNKKYQAGEVRAAIRFYHQALMNLKGITQGQDSIGSVLGMTEKAVLPADTEAAITKLRCDCHNNLAASLMLKDRPDYHRIISYCDQVTENQPNNHKAHFRKGQAYFKLGNYDQALKSFLAAKHHFGSTTAQMKSYIDKCHQALQEQHSDMKDMYKRMINVKN